MSDFGELNHTSEKLEEPLPNDGIGHSICEDKDKADTKNVEMTDSDENDEEASSCTNDPNYQVGKRCRKRRRKPCGCPKPRCRRRRRRASCPKPCCPKRRRRRRMRCAKKCSPKPPCAKPSPSSMEECCAECEPGGSNWHCRPIPYQRPGCSMASRRPGGPHEYQIYNGYYNFLRDFRHANGNLRNEDLAMNAAKAWSSLTQSEKNRYSQQSNTLDY